MNSRITIFCFCIALLGGLASAQPSPPAAPNAGPAQAEPPWPVKLGLRVHTVNQAFPLIDRVVLVPDAATYLDELAKWSPLGRWPVLIEDRVLTPMFVRRFKPAQVIRRESIGEQRPDNAARQKQIETIIVRAFGGDPAQHSAQDIFMLQKYAPQGVVIASLDDPAWTAAVALAAGRGQPIAWMNDNFAAPNDEINDETAMRLVRTVDGLLAQQPYTFAQMGDEIETITLCRAVATRARVNLPPIASANVGGPNADGPVAITDLLGRNADATRYAITGMIFGDEARCAYIAMCSLFLDRQRAWMCNTYPSDGAWAQYGMDRAAAMLEARGFAVQHNAGSSASEVAWMRQLIGGLSTDIVVMNTKGNSDFFDMFTGQCHPHDVPVLNEPAVLHLIHSWSMQFPQRLDTVGAQWLDRGAYAAVGSCWEPYLNAFVPPAELANRWVNMVPFLVSARWWDNQGPLSTPWRVVTFGDPLMLCAPAEHANKPRVNRAADYGVDLAEQAKSLMRQTESDESGKSYGGAIEILSMTGKDEIAVGLWRLADARGKGEVAARASLEPLFRMRDVDGFLRAWDQLPVRDAHAADMLWHLMAPRLPASNGPVKGDVLMQLQSAIRQPLPEHDLMRLAPALARALGKAHVQSVIQREMKKTNASGSQQALAELLKLY